MILEVLVICSLTTTSPFYDCSETWEIYLHDTGDMRPFCEYNLDRGTGEGCHKWDGKTNQQIHIALDKQHLKDVWKQTVLYHEIKHAMCKCDWH